MTVMVLRLDGAEYRLNTVPQSLRARGRYDYFHWAFESETEDISIRGTVEAAPASFVALPYRNPVGGLKTCLNSKIGSCHLTARRPGAGPRTLRSENRAAFEILTDDSDHGIPVLELDGGAGGIGRGRFAKG